MDTNPNTGCLVTEEASQNLGLLGRCSRHCTQQVRFGLPGSMYAHKGLAFPGRDTRGSQNCCLWGGEEGARRRLSPHLLSLCVALTLMDF